MIYQKLTIYISTILNHWIDYVQIIEVINKFRSFCLLGRMIWLRIASGHPEDTKEIAPQGHRVSHGKLLDSCCDNLNVMGAKVHVRCDEESLL